MEKEHARSILHRIRAGLSHQLAGPQVPYAEESRHTLRFLGEGVFEQRLEFQWRESHGRVGTHTSRRILSAALLERWLADMDAVHPMLPVLPRAVLRVETALARLGAVRDFPGGQG